MALRQPRHSPRTIRWLGCDCPVSNFEEKFGSVTKTIALYALLPLVWTAALPFFALTTTGPPLLATTGLISTACLYFQHALIVGLPCGPASTRDAVQKLTEYYGPRLAALAKLSATTMVVVLFVNTVVTFIFPPFGYPLVSAGLCLWGAALLLCCQSAAYISNKEDNWLTKRLSSILTQTGCWLEVATDFAAGVTAVKTGAKIAGGIVIAAGAIEFLMLISYTYSGLIAHNARTLATAAILELPVFAISLLTLVQQWQLPLSARLPLILSMGQTALGLISNASWIFFIAPMFFPGQALIARAVCAPQNASNLSSSVEKPLEAVHNSAEPCNSATPAADATSE